MSSGSDAGAAYDVWFTEDAGEFLARAGEALAGIPVLGTVLGTQAHRALRRPLDPAIPHRWFAVVTGEDGAVAGLAMRTAPFAPYPPYLLPMPDDAARVLAAAVRDRGEEVGGVAGFRPAADVFAAEVAASSGPTSPPPVSVHLHYRLFELGTLREPREVPGRLRAVRAEEADHALAWIHRFFGDADEQAGRTAGHSAEGGGFTIDDVLRKVEEGTLWYWVDAADRPVHLTGANPPASGVARIGPVFTPAEERGRGWGGAAVAAVSRLLRDAGARVTLFTDQANPTSNRLYRALGYEAVADTVELRIGGPA